MNIKALTDTVLSLGAANAAVLPLDQIVFDRIYRSICEQNGCGTYGACHMCPPDIGDIDTLIDRAKRYDRAILYQIICPIEDEFDIEGMLQGGHEMVMLSRAIEASVRFDCEHLHLSSGGCHICTRCTKRDGLPCRHPDEALTSLEAYGVDVYKTAANANLVYTNGPLTVTYFGMLLLREPKNVEA